VMLVIVALHHYMGMQQHFFYLQQELITFQ
jgi:hypothetical protein